MPEPFKGNKFKYSESELKDRGCEKFIPATDQKWQMKKATYTNEGVWQAFTKVRDSFRILLRSEGGYVYTEMAHNNAQAMMDRFLMARSRGKDITMPTEVTYVSNVTPEGGIALVSSDQFKDNPEVSDSEKVKWIFENMKLDDVTPEKAPSTGAWALLQELRTNDGFRTDFYKNIWPKVFIREEEKVSKLKDDGADVIKLIERLQKSLKTQKEKNEENSPNTK